MHFICRLLQADRLLSVVDTIQNEEDRDKPEFFFPAHLSSSKFQLQSAILMNEGRFIYR